MTINHELYKSPPLDGNPHIDDIEKANKAKSDTEVKKKTQNNINSKIS